MKKILALLLALTVSFDAYAVTRLYNRSSGDIIDADKDDAEWDNTNTEINTHEAATAVHGATGAVVGTSNTQTLTNKTLTSPTIITSPTAAGATWTDLGTATAFIATSATLITANIQTANFPTSNASIVGSTGAGILGLKAVGIPVNLNIVNSTTTDAADSIKIECGDATCSATNPGFIWLPSATGGDRTLFTVTSDVTLKLTGAHWGQGTKGDLTDAILRVSAVNAAGSIVWCVNYQSYSQRGYIGSATLDSTTATDINLPEELFCNAAIAADDPIIEVAWFKANFDDTGGAAEDLWAVQTGDGDLNMGNADGEWQSYNEAFGGFSANPTSVTARFVQYGGTTCVLHDETAGTSNAVTYSLSFPIKSERTMTGPIDYTDNSADATTPGMIKVGANSTSVSLYINWAEGDWTGSGTKSARFFHCYESFLP